MKRIDMKATGDNIQQRCKGLGLSLEDLSRMLDLDLSTLYYWFQGKSLPRWDTAVILADILHCRLDDLFVTVKEEEEDV